VAKGVDVNENDRYSELVPFTIRHRAVLELLPSCDTHRAGRTAPIEFALRIDEAVDPSQPFVCNEDLEIRFYTLAEPPVLVQTSHLGERATGYHIDTGDEHHITKFKTRGEPTVYGVEIWRMNRDFLIDSFTFETDR